MNEITRILQALEHGDPTGAEELLPLVYDELRRLAKHKLAQELPGQTLQPTALVHEAFLRLVGGENPTSWDGRGHFFAAAAEAMRRILVEQARRKKSLKRGGNFGRIDLEPALHIADPSSASADDLLALDEALTEFEALDPLRAQVVKLHYFSGFSQQETAEALGISLATVKRHWVFAKSWLYCRIRGERE